MGWNPIVVGVDGSPESVRAAVTAAALAERAGTRCVPVHAVPDYLASFTVPEAAMDVSGVEELAVAHAREFITGVLQGEVRPAVLAQLRIAVGRAPMVLGDAIEQLDASLLVLGGKHHRGLDRIGGSTVTHMARTVEVPLLVTDGASPTIARVLAAVDVSYAATPTLAWAERMADLFGARLRVIHVVEPVPLIPGVPITIGDEDYYRGEVGILERRVWPRVRRPGTETVVRRGRAAAAIADEVVQWGADLVVLGSHGKGWVDRTPCRWWSCSPACHGLGHLAVGRDRGGHPAARRRAGGDGVQAAPRLLLGGTTEGLIRELPTATLAVPVARPAPRGLEVGALPWEEREATGSGAAA